MVRIPVLSAFSPTLFDLAELYVSGRVLLRDHQNGVADLFGYARRTGWWGWILGGVNSWRVFQLGRLPVGVVAGGASLRVALLTWANCLRTYPNRHLTVSPV